MRQTIILCTGFIAITTYYIGRGFYGLDSKSPILIISLIILSIASRAEIKILEKRGEDYRDGTQLGNKIAKFLSIIILCFVIWLLYLLALNFINLKK